MSSLVPTRRREFADKLKLYDVFSVYPDGRDEVRVISNPEIHTNLVGTRKYITFKGDRINPHGVGNMIVPLTSTVYIRNKHGVRKI